MIRRSIGTAFSALALCVIVHSIPAAAQSADDEALFAGKTVTYLTSAPSASDSDRLYRALAAEMRKALSATVVVRNLPDAGREGALQRLASAPADGLTIAAFPGSAVYDQLTGQSPVDVRRLSWIGAAAGDPHVLVVPARSPIHSVKDLRQPGDPFVIGAARVGSPAYIEGRLLRSALKLNATLVAGFRVGDDVRSLNSGTIDAVFGPECLYRELVDDDDARVILRFGAVDAGDDTLAKLLRHQDDGAREVMGLLQSVAALGTVTAAPAGVPARQLQVLRTTFRQAMESDAVRAAATGPLTAMGGRDVARAIGDALHPGPHASALIRDVFDVDTGPVLAGNPTDHTSPTVVSFVGH
jgi:tripartite-type tricarboxylate transporter receptor subunit TctC